MQTEFCSYEQALALKELGFDEPCMAIYYSKDKSFSWHHHIDHTNQEPVLESGEFNISAPLKQQVFRWFREKYNLVHSITYPHSETNKIEGINSVYFDIEIYTLLSGNAYKTYLFSGYSNKYEEAEDACIDKLIEIIKNKDL